MRSKSSLRAHDQRARRIVDLDEQRQEVSQIQRATRVDITVRRDLDGAGNCSGDRES